MISENSTKKTQARAFSYFAFAGNVGLLLGPFIGTRPSKLIRNDLLTLIGGALSNPAEQYSDVFGKFQLFKSFPYALPTVATGLVSATAATTTLLFVKEVCSLPMLFGSNPKHKQTLTPERRAKNAGSGQGPMSVWELLKAPGVAKVIYIYGHVMFLAFGYTASTYIALSNQATLTKMTSHAGLLVHQSKTRRVWLFAIRNVPAHVRNRYIPGSVDPFRLPTSPEALGYRRCPTRMYTVLADILCLSTIEQLLS
jgi:hypothetical protein